MDRFSRNRLVKIGLPAGGIYSVNRGSKNRVTITIMGEEYTIRGSGPPESMEQAARYVDRLMRSLSEENRQQNSYKIAVLAAINLADELLKERGSYPSLDMEEREKEGEDELV